MASRRADATNSRSGRLTCQEARLATEIEVGRRGVRSGDAACAVKGKSTQPVRVRPKEVSVRLGSYPGDGEGDRPVETLGTTPALGGPASVRAAT